MIVVRYRPTEDQADHDQRLVEDVFAELGATDPGGVRYATLRLDDGTFVHIADVTADPNPLGSVEAEPREAHGRPYSLELTLPPLSALLLEPGVGDS